MEAPGWNSSKDIEFFFSEKKIRPIPDPTQPPNQGVMVFFKGVKRQRCDFNHSSPSASGIKNKWRYTSSPPLCLHVMNGYNITFCCAFDVD